MIGVSLAARNTEDVLNAFDDALEIADILELRIDLMDECDLARIIPERPCQLVVTNRTKAEGGGFEGGSSDRVRPLLQAIDLGVEYVDIEEDGAHLIDDRGTTRLIVSHHDFESIPEHIDKVCRRIAERGANVVKLVGMAVCVEDAFKVLGLLGSSPLPSIAIAMGEHGLSSRILALRHDNCLLTYCAPESEQAVAPGQIPASVMANIYQAKSIGDGTRAIGVVSRDPIPTSVLGELNRGLRRSDIDAVAIPLRLATVDGARLMRLAKCGFDGFWNMDGVSVGPSTDDGRDRTELEGSFATVANGEIRATVAPTIELAISLIQEAVNDLPMSEHALPRSL